MSLQLLSDESLPLSSPLSLAPHNKRMSCAATSAATTHSAVPATSVSAKIPFCVEGAEQTDASQSVHDVAAAAAQVLCAANMSTRCVA
eukprot:CAMPEP_0198692468 /NCGR_PEP_ID=MMETSP1468-20131203/228332_1 /TAXON_ID=1461545 /ORGANISM="Mantoniella sp, Strain CCMP1436" /LENGTH=87 /DNA_ID=CAMNT_0044446419 /DNA_START=359 /DNA_END=619 /DNA_ORIENTATION=-